MKAPYDTVTVEVRHVQMGCGHAFRQWPDGPAQCPFCFPDQPKPFGERRHDPNEFLGIEWFWNEALGPTGMWDLCDRFTFILRSDGEAFKEALNDLPTAILKELYGTTNPFVTVTRMLATELKRRYAEQGLAYDSPIELGIIEKRSSD